MVLPRAPIRARRGLPTLSRGRVRWKHLPGILRMVLLTRLTASCLVLALTFGPAVGQAPHGSSPTARASAETIALKRRDREGEQSSYLMTGLNEQWRYAIHAAALVRRGLDGKYHEEVRWSHLISDHRNREIPLTPRDASFHQDLSLLVVLSPHAVQWTTPTSLSANSFDVLDLRILRLALELRSGCSLQINVKESADVVRRHANLAAAIEGHNA
jgi:hypothetical protein